MIRNNQNGRRRGRGGGAGGGGGARPPQGAPSGGNYTPNRGDNRQRGNANQLLEKYKSLARDAAQQGDRVTAEYFMQYADHYYRVLNDYRVRENEARPQARRDQDDDGERADGLVEVVVADAGRGLVPTGTPADRTGSTGVGLAIAERLAVASGGRLQRGASELGGARFTLTRGRN